MIGLDPHAAAVMDRSRRIIDATVAEVLDRLGVKDEATHRVALTVGRIVAERVTGDMLAEVELIRAFHDLRLSMQDLTPPRILVVPSDLVKGRDA